MEPDGRQHNHDCQTLSVLHMIDFSQWQYRLLCPRGLHTFDLSQWRYRCGTACFTHPLSSPVSSADLGAFAPIPNEVMLLIGGFLSFYDNQNMMLVCKHFYALFTQLESTCRRIIVNGYVAFERLVNEMRMFERAKETRFCNSLLWIDCRSNVILQRKNFSFHGDFLPSSSPMSFPTGERDTTDLFLVRERCSEDIAVKLLQVWRAIRVFVENDDDWQLVFDMWRQYACDYHRLYVEFWLSDPKESFRLENFYVVYDKFISPLNFERIRAACHRAKGVLFSEIGADRDAIDYWPFEKMQQARWYIHALHFRVSDWTELDTYIAAWTTLGEKLRCYLSLFHAPHPCDSGSLFRSSARVKLDFKYVPWKLRNRALQCIERSFSFLYTD